MFLIFGSVSLNLPSLPVAEPICVPFIMIVVPGKGVLFSSSTTPLISLFCGVLSFFSFNFITIVLSII